MVGTIDTKLVYLEGVGPGETEWSRFVPARTRTEAESWYQLAAAPFILAGVQFRFVEA